MGNAYFQMGMVTTERVREKDVRDAVRALGLGVCYKNALQAAESHATGIAVATLSYDAQGAPTPILQGSEFLPGMTVCLRNRLARATIAAAAVEQQGGVATVQLVFKNEGF
jgi:hypothetical protein